jgi:trk system potassium uptake protein TrkH
MREPSLDVRPVLLIVGLLLTTLALAMLLPAAIDALAGSPDWRGFLAASIVTLFLGQSVMLSNRTGTTRLSPRQTFLVTVLGWASVAATASLPFMLSPLDLSPTDAVFEAVSGITTTGATVIHDLAKAPPGILLWRGILQWLGGIGMIVMALTVLPTLKIGGMQIFRLESGEGSDKVMPRAARITSAVGLVYLGLTALLGAALWLEGMTGFDALIHAMTTISTGGFSTSDYSLMLISTPLMQLTITLGMAAGGVPFLAYLQLLHGQSFAVRRDPQLRWYAALLLIGGGAVSLWLWVSYAQDPADALRYGFFTATSIMTGTGFVVVDYNQWAGLPLAIQFFLMFVGGCAGSTAAGIKVFRFQILLANARVQIQRLLSPHAVLIPDYNRKPIPDHVAESVMGFLFVYTLAFATLAMALAMLGLDFITALSAAASAIGNIGPGIGQIGPLSTHAGLSDPIKWLLCGGMLFGRLEMFAVLVIFTPAFWRA